MKNETAMTRISVANLEPGQIVHAGYKRRGQVYTSRNGFLCFRAGDQKFYSLKQLKDYFGVRTLKELEFEHERIFDSSVTAEFRDLEGDFLWGAYLWNGAFRVGTSADRLTFQ